MIELPLAHGEQGVRDSLIKCNICGTNAEFIVDLELARNKQNCALHALQMPFYLCNDHAYIYKKMQRSIELKDYFPETIRENQ